MKGHHKITANIDGDNLTSWEISPGLIRHTLGAEEDRSLCPRAGLLRWGVFGETGIDWFRLLKGKDDVNVSAGSLLKIKHVIS